MTREKVKDYINGIHQIMSEQLNLVYDYHSGGDVEGCADDFPFFNLFVHLKKNLYEVMLNDLHSQGKNVLAYLEELNTLPEFKEIGVSFKVKADGIDFPPISQFVQKKHNKDYVFYNLNLFAYNRYTMGLEYVLFKFLPYFVEDLYETFKTMDGEWTYEVKEQRSAQIEWILRHIENPAQATEDSSDECPNDDFVYVGYFDSLEFTEEDMTDEDGYKYASVEDVPLNIKWRRFLEQVGYYYYCLYRRYPCNWIEPDLQKYYQVDNLWSVNTDKTVGCCLVKNMGAEDEDIIDLFVSVPYLGENLVRAFHDVKAGACYLGKIAELTGTPGLHLTPKCKERLRARKEEYLSSGYIEVKDNPDYHNRTNEGIDYFDFEAMFETKKLWPKDYKPVFLDKNHYLSQILYLQWTINGAEINEANREALKNNQPFELLGKEQLLKTYDSFLVCVLKCMASEVEAGKIKTSALEDVLKRTYQAMHKLYVSSAIVIKTARVDAKTSKTKLQAELGVKRDGDWINYAGYYGKPFEIEKLKKISQLLGYDLLERIE